MAGDSATQVEEVILGLPREEQIIVRKLRSLVLECLPYVEEKNNYGAPYYVGNRLMLFIWPPSLHWGKNPKFSDKGVTFGFCQGNKMDNSHGLLLSEGRKQVYCLYFKTVREIDDRFLRALIYEADMVDKQFRKKSSAGSQKGSSPRQKKTRRP